MSNRIMICLVLILSFLATSCYSIIQPVDYQSVREISSSTTNNSSLDADIIVVGSSLAGWAASIAASREGADVILITETDCIGGQATCAGVSTWDGSGYGLDKYFHATLSSEYKMANVRLGGCYATPTEAEPDTYITGDNFCPHPQAVEAELLSWMRFYSVSLVGPVDVLEITTGGEVITTEGILKAKIVIEATETGELIPTSIRRDVDPLCKQYTTWVAGMREPGQGGEKISDISYPTDPEYMALLEDWWVNDKYHWAHLAGEEGLPAYRRTHDVNGDVVIYLNWMNDATTAEKSKDKTMQMLVFLSNHGYGDWRWGMRPIPYTRTSDYRLNGQEHLDRVVRDIDTYPNSIAVANYRADYHGSKCSQLEGVEPYGDYDIPAGIGIPAERVPLLVAMPRSADISDLRSTSFRMQPDEMNFGEAIGVLAAISVENDKLPHDVNIETVRAKLLEYGARVDV